MPRWRRRDRSGLMIFDCRRGSSRSFPTWKRRCGCCHQALAVLLPVGIFELASDHCGRRISSVLSLWWWWFEIGLGAAMKLVVALAGAVLLSLICEKAEAQVAREAFYSIPSETVSAADFDGQERHASRTRRATAVCQNGFARQPVVILLHSASGPIAEGAPYEEWPRS